MSIVGHRPYAPVEYVRRGLGRLAAGIGLAGVLALAAGCGPAPGYETITPASYDVPPPEARSADDDTPGISTSERGQRLDDPEAIATAAGGNAADVDIGASGGDEYADNDPSALTDFRPALEGHGTWVDDATYGTVWVPSETEVGSDFTPYVSAGHWTYDDSANYVWVSDYSWGWAPFHYGRWTRIHRHGWVWIPGRTYAGAWVVWRTGGPGYDYVGWAPAPPDWYWMNGYAYAWTWGYSPYYYSYCNRHYLYSPGFGGHVYYGYTARGREIEARTVPYRQAAPPADRGRVAAAPSVGGRVAAAPSVGGGDRVAANPSVGGRVKADPRVAGPSPAELGIDRAKVPAPNFDSKGMQRAKAFAEPSTATALGAQAPSTSRRLNTSRPLDRELVTTSPRVTESRDPRSSALRSPMVSSPGVGPRSSNLDPVARSPQYGGAPGAVQPNTYPSRVAPTRIPDSGPLPSYRPNVGGPSVASPSTGNAPVMRDVPNNRATSSAPLPEYRSPSVHTPSDGMRSAGPLPSTPSVRAPSAPQVSSPAIRPSSPSPQMRSAPSAPMIRSTPSAPSMRSAPSAPAIRPSSPSVSRPSSAPSIRGGGVRSRR